MVRVDNPLLLHMDVSNVADAHRAGTVPGRSLCVSSSTSHTQEELAAAGATTEDSYLGHGVQIVVGHYNGRLPDERKKNLTFGSAIALLLKP